MRPDLAHEVEHECRPAAGGDRQDLVHAVRIEGRKGDLRRLVGCQIEVSLAILVAHHELAALRLRRQRQHQRGEHADSFLGVAMADEEAALVIDQQLVELGGDGAGHAEPLGRACNDACERLWPVLAADGDPHAFDLPRPAHLRVDHGLGAPAKGGARCRLDQLLGLCRKQR